MSYIKMETLQKLGIQCPDLQEQKRIATILNFAQNEIRIYKEIPTKYRIQGQGLFPKYFTAQWQVKDA